MASAAIIVLFWLIAALLVAGVDMTLAHVEPWVNVGARAIAIVVAALAYMRLAAPRATLEHAIGVGALWLFFGILLEVAMSAHTGRGCYELLGSPDSALRNVLLIAWVVAPALFARHQS